MKIDRYVWHRNGSLLLLLLLLLLVLFFVFMSVISFLNENNFMREIFSFLGPVNTMPNKFENASFFHLFWPKTYEKFSVHTNPEEIRKCKAAREIKQDNSDVSGFEMFRFQNVLRPQKNG